MAYTNEQRLGRWVRQQAFANPEQSLERLVIRHAPAGAKGTLVLEKNIGQVDDDNIKLLIEEVYSSIQDDANGLGGQQRYIVEAWLSGRDTLSGRFSCRVTGNDDEDNDQDGVDTEGPTPKGMISQGMRHNEAIMKTFAGTIGVMMGTMQRMVQQQAEQIEKLTEQRWRSLEAIETAQTQTHEREISGMIAASEQERKDKVFEKLTLLLPAVVNKIAGGKYVPEPVSPKEMMLKDLVTSLTPEQFQRIGAALAPEQQVAFMQLLQTVQAEMNAAKSSPSNGA